VSNIVDKTIDILPNMEELNFLSSPLHLVL